MKTVRWAFGLAAMVVVMLVIIVFSEWRFGSDSRDSTTGFREDPIGNRGDRDVLDPGAPVGSVQGVVVAMGLAEPPESIPVELHRTDRPGGHRATSAEGGVFSFRNVPVGDALVRVNAPYPFVVTDRKFRVVPGEETQLRMVLEARFRLRLKVVTGTPGRAAEPVSGARLQLIPRESWVGSDGAPSETAGRFVVASGDGTAEFSEVPTGKFILFASARDHVDQYRDLDFSPRAMAEHRFLHGEEMLIRLPGASHGLEGVILDPDGQPLDGCLVCLGPDPREPQQPRFARRSGRALAKATARAPAFAVTDAHGRFSIQIPEEQEGCVLFACPGDPSLPPMYPFMVWVKTERPRPLELRIPSCPRVLLTVETKEGAQGQGDVRVVGERLTLTHLGEDPFLSKVPGFSARFEPARQPGTVDLRLRPGAYRVLYEDGERTHTFALTVKPDTDVVQTFTVPED